LVTFPPPRVFWERTAPSPLAVCFSLFTPPWCWPLYRVSDPPFFHPFVVKPPPPKIFVSGCPLFSSASDVSLPSRRFYLKRSHLCFSLLFCFHILPRYLSLHGALCSAPTWRLRPALLMFPSFHQYYLSFGTRISFSRHSIPLFRTTFPASSPLLFCGVGGSVQKKPLCPPPQPRTANFSFWPFPHTPYSR